MRSPFNYENYGPQISWKPPRLGAPSRLGALSTMKIMVHKFHESLHYTYIAWMTFGI